MLTILAAIDTAREINSHHPQQPALTPINRHKALNISHSIYPLLEISFRLLVIAELTDELEFAVEWDDAVGLWRYC
jgi:hypothetical protein